MPRPQVVVNDEHVTRVTVTPTGDDDYEDEEEEDTLSTASSLAEDDELPIKYYRDRKLSLMPALTEEDMLSALGAKDPESVSLIISSRRNNEDAAPMETPVHAITRIGIGQSGERVIQGVLAAEASICPEMCPETMKQQTTGYGSRSGGEQFSLRSRPIPTTVVTQDDESNGYENNVDLPAGTKLKFRSNHNPPARSQSENVNLRRPQAPTLQQPSFVEEHLKSFTAEIAAENPDMIHFQQVLNSWIIAQSGAQAAAFLLISSECNSCFCQVCGSNLLDEPVNCGDASVLTSLFSPLDTARSSTSSSSRHSSSSCHEDIEQRALDLDQVDPDLRERILEIIADGMPKCARVEGTVIPVKARCGFVTGLVMIHQSIGSKTPNWRQFCRTST